MCMFCLQTMTEVWIQYPARKGHYTRKELSYLSMSLGFPHALLAKAFENSVTMQIEWNRLVAGKTIRERALIQLLESKALDHKLEKVFNKYPAKYNVKLIKKALSLLRHKQMTFSEISDARVAFEVHVCEDGSGMAAELQTVMPSLKLLERVMSPLKLETEIQKYQLHSEVPMRFQMYEFFSLVALCEKCETVEVQMTLSAPNLEGPNACESDTALSLPDFDQILMTSDQKVHKYLDSEYRASLYKEVEPTPPVLDTEHIVSSGPRRSLISLAHEQSRALSPSLEESQSQLHRARSGYWVLSPKQYQHHLQDSQESVPLQSPARLHIPPEKHKQRDPLHSSCVMKSPQKPIRFNFSRVPQAIRPAPTLCTSPQGSKEQQQACSDGTGRTNKMHELSTAIDNVCIVESVIKARSALKSSLASLPQPQLQEDKCTSPSQPSGVTLKGYGRAQSHTPNKLPQSEETDVHKLHFEPVVSEDEIKLHQALIDELEWNALRRRRNDK